MQRRDIIKALGAGTAATALAACAQQGGSTADCAEGGNAAGKKVYKWKMVTSWPKNFPGLGSGAAYLAKLIPEMTGGRIEVKLFSAGELVPAFEVFDAVSQGTAELGHSAAYYYKGKHPATQFFTAVPFGMTAQEMSGWLYQGGGMQLWEKLYDRFNLIPNDAGNTGAQLGGWFNKEINSIADLKGLKMRIPGLAGEAMERLGAAPVNLPGGEIFTSMQSGAIDATEWVGPYNDLAFGFHQVAKHYYYTPWHEPSATLDCMINKDAFNSLPADLQVIVRAACRVTSQQMLAEYTTRNNSAMKALVEKHNVDMRPFPTDVTAALRKTSKEVVAEIAKTDAISKEIYDSYTEYLEQATAYHRISEQEYMNIRNG